MKFLKNEMGWADFFITRVGLIIFAAVLLLSAFKIYPMFQEREASAGLDVITSEIASKIEAVDSTTIPGYRYSYVFDNKVKDADIEISTEFVVARRNFSTGIWGERELLHAEQLVMHIYPPNNNWTNTSGFRKFLGDELNHSGDASSPLDISDKSKVDNIFEKDIIELARSPFKPDKEKPLYIEKLLIYYNTGKETITRDYVMLYQ